LVQKELIKETGLRNRGIKSGNFQVLRETKMVSILAECGFMDNIEEAKLMLDENYQMKCARAIAKGICKYFGVEYKEEKKDEPSQWGKDDWEWGIKEGITDGKNPQGIPTREQVVSMIRRSKALE
ncbi:N-acetylmuramoyl-L-alanine amidase family protein, partial [Tissierella praeacuta]|uniref:N-acetylmuramoyl-L-alanine amidase family protein n=1 Tax=Tissierella praeacuta TaxID=43131 RepID=UPI003DA1F567